MSTSLVSHIHNLQNSNCHSAKNIWFTVNKWQGVVSTDLTLIFIKH